MVALVRCDLHLRACLGRSHTSHSHTPTGGLSGAGSTCSRAEGVRAVVALPGYFWDSLTCVRPGCSHTYHSHTPAGAPVVTAGRRVRASRSWLARVRGRAAIGVCTT